MVQRNMKVQEIEMYELTLVVMTLMKIIPRIFEKEKTGNTPFI